MDSIQFTAPPFASPTPTVEILTAAIAVSPIDFTVLVNPAQTEVLYLGLLGFYNLGESMFVKHASSGALVEIVSLEGLFDPTLDKVMGCLHAGEEMQDAEYFTKAHLTFPSGEPLPQCWVDVDYRAHSQPH